LVRRVELLEGSPPRFIHWKIIGPFGRAGKKAGIDRRR